MDGVNYSSKNVPDKYRCSRCGRHGVRLWRDYMCIPPDLFCYKCILADPSDWEKDMSVVTARVEGALVLAIPDEEGVGYWGYTSCPSGGVDWWYGLPID